MADTVNILSWNVRGLNSPHKRSLMFSYLKKYKPHFICLQETHLMAPTLKYLKRPWLASQYHATYSSFSRGVSILVAKALRAETECTDRPCGSVCSAHYSHSLLNFYTGKHLYPSAVLSGRPLQTVTDATISISRAPALCGRF